MNILLIEDHQNIAESLDYAFTNQGYSFITVSSYREAVTYLKAHTPTLIILDLGLPDGDGLDLYKEQIIHRKIPTIILSAQSDEDVIVDGLTLGAEDYITKPFSTKELLARVKKIQLRLNKTSIIKVRDVTFDIEKQEVRENGQIVHFTGLELRIFHLLMTNLNRVIPRDFILDKVWEWTGNDVNENTITVYIKRIRAKLNTDLITTIKGVGYRIDFHETQN